MIVVSEEQGLAYPTENCNQPDISEEIACKNWPSILTFIDKKTKRLKIETSYVLFPECSPKRLFVLQPILA
jgi:hypothetical protein